MVDEGGIVAADGAGRVEQRRQQVFLDVADVGGVLLQAVKDVLDVGGGNGQNQGVSNIEITDSNIKSFERVARKYGVDFAVKKDRSVSPPKYLVFFKGRDADALTAAFREYTAKEVKRASQEKPSVLEQLRALKAKVLSLTPDKARNKDKGLEL